VPPIGQLGDAPGGATTVGATGLDVCARREPRRGALAPAGRFARWRAGWIGGATFLRCGTAGEEIDDRDDDRQRRQDDIP
jgi:hypothetical protein